MHRSVRAGMKVWIEKNQYFTFLFKITLLMLLLGIDLGTSSIKVSVVDAQSQSCLVSVQYPDSETPIETPHPGWAEQSPDMWWDHVQQAIKKANASGKYNPADIGAIGIAYQMHGLVMVDKNQNVLRPSIIWCDSRAVEIGDKAFAAIGEEKCLSHLLNSPGNFTASKLAWVKANEPAVYEKADKIMLPGDYISMKLTGEINSSISALSEGIFWDFAEDRISRDVLSYYGIDENLLPAVQPLFSSHGQLKEAVANSLSLRPGIPVSYKAGDQPNNALSLNVLNPGEVAATAGTSGVIYGVSDKLAYDPQSRVNSFAHVNYMPGDKRIGILLCINGTGIMNRWIRSITGSTLSYPEINLEAASVQAGSAGLQILPFGNGAERMLNNKMPGASMRGLDLNVHSRAHLYRAVQEGLVFSFRYGLDILRENGMQPKVIRAGSANMFLSDLFTNIFVNTTGTPVELFNGDGSVGAALGGGIGAGIFKEPREAFQHFTPLKMVEPNGKLEYEEFYQNWKRVLQREIA